MATNFKDISDRLWNAADKLRANTHLKVSEYSVPVLGLIFLKFADQKFTQVDRLLRTRLPALDNTLAISPSRYKAEGAIYLDKHARFGYLRTLSKNIDDALNNAMRLIEADNDSLAGSLPTNGYTAIDNDTLKGLLAAFDSIPLDIEGNLFGKIYEYFLGKFAPAEGRYGDEFFTPTSIVKLIVEIIEPYHGLIFDPACGTGGTFVQCAQFIQRHHLDPNEEVSIYGQERTLETVRLCKMSLAVHGLVGDVLSANSYYEDPHRSTGKFDFVIVNSPPFNVKSVDKTRLLEPKKRFPFDPPRTDNANYLWIQLFYSALNAKGRAGFVMPNFASDGRASEQDIRRKLINQHVVDVMVSVGPNFFLTITLSCTIWFFDKGKRETERVDKILFIDAKQHYLQIDRAHREFTTAQIEFFANIVRLYRGERAEDEGGSAALMQEHFPDDRYTDIAGLCKVATLADIEAQGWSLNPGRYVGVTKYAIEDFDFKERLEKLHEELTWLNLEAHTLEAQINENVIKILDQDDR